MVAPVQAASPLALHGHHRPAGLRHRRRQGIFALVVHGALNLMILVFGLLSLLVLPFVNKAKA